MKKPSPDDISDIEKYYDTQLELQRYQSQQLEFRIATKIFDHSFTSPTRILELGSGAGFYTLYLSQKGHSIEGIELSQKLTKIGNQSLKQAGFSSSRITAGDARSLESLNKEYQAVLIMGPLYHLIENNEREKLLLDVKQKLLPGAKVFSVFLTRVGLISYMLYKYPQWVNSASNDIESVFQHGKNTSHPKEGSFRGYFSTIEEASQLHNKCGLSISEIYCLDPCIGGADEIFNRLPEELKEPWSQKLYEFSKNSDFWGSGRTFMVVSEI